MFKNYLKIAFRNLLKRKSFTFINVAGLAIGMACFLLIWIYVQFELSYDGFHEKADQIYRVAIERKYPDKVTLWGRTAMPIAPTFQSEYPEIIKGTRLIANNNAFQITLGDKNIYNEKVIFADPNFFDVFTIPLAQGDPATALAEQNSAVLTRETARMLFGNDDPMLKTLTINNVDYTITGIAEDIPGNSHFHFDFLLSLITIPNAYNGQQWINAWGAFTYLLCQEGTDPEVLEAKFPAMVTKYMAPEVVDEVGSSFEDFVAAGNGYRFFLQPLKDIHLKSKLAQEIEPNGNITYVYLFSLISIFILVIACINFMNLTTARSASRAKEVAVRKTVGSSRKQIIGQFLFESIMLSGLALLVALALVSVILRYFNSLVGQELKIGLFSTPFLLPGLILFALTIGILAGSYPALFLSSFQPVTALKGRLRTGSLNNRLRNALVIFQFTIAIVLIVSTVIVSGQIEYMLNKDLGFEKEHVIVIRNGNVLGQQVLAFKQNLLTESKVIGASGSFSIPGGAFDGNVHRQVDTSEDRAVSLSNIFADYDFVQTMGMEVIAGRNFSQEFGTEQNAYILNETAVRLLGLQDPVNARITDHFRTYTIVGVLRDFHFKSLHNEISPLAYAVIPGNQANFISVRIQQENISETLAILEKKWQEFTGGRPFEFSFLDDDLRTQYEAEQKTKLLTGILSAIAIFIGCLGLFGLASFTAEQRTKEIGIRKVMGGSVTSIIFLLIKDFTKLVGIAFLIASPLAYLAMMQWLKNFRYSINLSVPPFIIAGVLALGIALLTVSYQAVKAALHNPTDSLKYE
ncbi:ABC transporter permease [Acidobacteriota bacterium]